MRYFIAKTGSTIIEKQVIEGDNVKIDALVDQYKLNHPGFVVLELDQSAFDATVMVPVQSQAQKDWATFKVQQPTPTALQGVLYLARYLNLE